MRGLLIRPGAIGDFILSLPALECARAGYTEVWAAGPNVPLARFADRARPIVSTGLDLLEVGERRVFRELERFDSILSWYGANRAQFRESVRGLPFHFFPALPDNPGMHAADFYLEQVRGLAPCHSGGVPRIACPAVRGDFAIIHPFASSAKKRWPLERFREVAAKLDIPVQWCRGPEEDLPGAFHIKDLYELGCRLAGAHVFLGNDSGITHLAAAVGTPVVALFGPTDPAVWGPRGPRVRILRKGPAMEAISVADVLSALAQ